ncbi:DUF4352 domain-containing protein [Ruania halotolerans]|uniref:DUF4352 domain-containing protein n=1 Tax=Ruania halotolerans TaxID=2897773 RepID=UPI001E44741F|nr:DUF4352 domain-containing protein [Ruania halotolerans]UFU04909.1 DUF4352 domain-containing protein [Ruania halotolerans]
MSDQPPQYGQQPPGGDPHRPPVPPVPPNPAYGQQPQPGYGPDAGQPGGQYGHGQPAGQTAFGQPGYGAPGHDGTAYGQPGYGAPGGPAGPGGPGGPDSGKNKTPVVIAVIVGVVVLALLIFGLTRVFGGNEPEETSGPTSEPTTEQPSDEPTQEPTDSQEPSEDPSGDAPEEPSGNPEFITLGETTTVGDWTVSVHDPVLDATDEIVSSDNPEPPSGLRYSYVYVTVTNDGSESMELFDSLVMGYFDAAGEAYSSSEAVAPDDAYFLDPVEPGEEVSGTYIFEIPADDRGDGTWAIAERTEDSADGDIAFFVAE